MAMKRVTEDFIKNRTNEFDLDSIYTLSLPKQGFHFIVRLVYLYCVLYADKIIKKFCLVYILLFESLLDNKMVFWQFLAHHTANLFFLII